MDLAIVTAVALVACVLLCATAFLMGLEVGAATRGRADLAPPPPAYDAHVI